MKISDIVKAIAPHLATDADPAKVTGTIAQAFAADKKARDEAEEKEQAAKDAAAEYFGHSKDEWEKMSAKDRKAARDKAAKDAEADDPEATNDSEMDDVDGEDEFPEAPKGGAPKPGGKDKAMDAAGVASVVAKAIAANDAKHAAARAVEPILGVVTYDSAESYYKAALDKLGVATDGVHPSAYGAMLKIAKDRASKPAPIASDSAAVSSMVTAIPGYGRLK